MIEIEPEVPRQARIIFMVGGGVVLFALVMVVTLIGRTPEPSQVMDSDPEPPIQQRYNVDPLRIRRGTPEQEVGTNSTATTRPATRPTTRPTTRRTTRPTTVPATQPAARPATFSGTRR